MQHSELAVNKFTEGFNCAQSIVFAFSDALIGDVHQVFRAATGFGGGMGRNQEVCGAVTGGIIVLSLLLGRGENDDADKQETAFTAVRQLMDGFASKFGTLVCSKLVDGCVLLSPEGQERFKAENLKAKCCGFVEQAAELLDGIIAEKNGKRQPVW